jgi:hypothetical protein
VKQDEKPVMGLKTSKNFITANAVEAILEVPGNRARVKRQPPVYKEKPDYGKVCQAIEHDTFARVSLTFYSFLVQVPEYLKDVKQEIEQENDMIEEFVRQNKNILAEQETQVEPMDDKERQDLVDALKAKWDHVNGKYQKLCHHVSFDTQGKVRRKENYEKELSQIEKDIQTLSKASVVIARD